MSSWARTMLLEGDAALDALISRSAVEPAFALSVLRLVLLAELGDWTGRIVAHLDEASWSRGDCPVCGAWPALAESRGPSSGASCAAIAVAPTGRATGCSAPTVVMSIIALCALSSQRANRTAAGWLSATGAAAGSR